MHSFSSQTFVATLLLLLLAGCVARRIGRGHETTEEILNSFVQKIEGGQPDCGWTVTPEEARNFTNDPRYDLDHPCYVKVVLPPPPPHIEPGEAGWCGSYWDTEYGCDVYEQYCHQRNLKDAEVKRVIHDASKSRTWIHADKSDSGVGKVAVHMREVHGHIQLHGVSPIVKALAHNERKCTAKYLVGLDMWKFTNPSHVGVCSHWYEQVHKTVHSHSQDED